MTTTLREKNLKQNIEQHSRSSSFFQSWIDNVRCNYRVVSASMEPGRDPFWGYCAESHEYFISENVPAGKIRNAILQTVYRRISKNDSHLSAAQFLIGMLRDNFPRVEIIETMRHFYSWEANELRESGKKADDYAKDIDATEGYLKLQLGM